MKSILFILLFIISSFSFAQHNEIVKLLNQQFKEEQSMYEDFEIDKPSLIKEFQIKNDTLSFGVSIENGKEIVYSEVHLKDITGIIKDINVIFTTNENKVKETHYLKDENGNPLPEKIYYTNLFFTRLSKNQEDEFFLKPKIIKAFEKVGYTINSEVWAN